MTYVLVFSSIEFFLCAIFMEVSYSFIIGRMMKMLFLIRSPLNLVGIKKYPPYQAK